MQVLEKTGVRVHTLYCITTSPRSPAGLLTLEAWDLLRAYPVYARSATETTRAVEEQKVNITLLPEEHAAAATKLRELLRHTPLVLLSEEKPELLHDLDVQQVQGSWDPPGAHLLDAVRVMDQLRSPGGCAWDAEHTHQTLLPYLVEETYEAYDAIESDDRSEMIEELGDLLLQPLFHARIGEEGAEPWSIDDVAAALVHKLVSRHPHVFQKVDAPTFDEVSQQWEKIKHAEKQRSSVLDGVARSQPALALAAKYLQRVERFEVKVEVPEMPQGASLPSDEEGIGDALLAFVAAARAHGVDPEGALRAAAHRYATRVRVAENLVK